MRLTSYSDFRFENHPSILVASHIVIAAASTIHRVVLRKVGDNEYVTHVENVILEDNVCKHGDFHTGHYFEDQHAALKDYEDRSKRL